MGYEDIKNFDDAEYNATVVDNYDTMEYDAAGSQGQYYGKELEFEKWVRTPEAQNYFVHINKDISGSNLDVSENALLRAIEKYRIRLKMLKEQDLLPDDDLHSNQIVKMSMIVNASLGRDGFLQKTRNTRIIQRTGSYLDQTPQSAFSFFRRRRGY